MAVTLRGILCLILLLRSWYCSLTFARLPRTRGKRRLGGVEPRYYQQEAANLFFQRAEEIRKEKDRPMRMQLVGGAGKTHIYAMIASRSLAEQPSRRVAIFVPWRTLAFQTCQKLRECGFHASMLGDGNSKLDPMASVVVCVYNSAHLLRGQHFHVKIIDEAHHLHSDGFLTNMINGITADLEAEFTATFHTDRSDDLDYLYSFEKAVHDGFVCDLNSYILPLAFDQQRMLKLAELIRLKKAEWSPMLVVFNKLRRARDFAVHLQHQQVRAEAVAHRDPKTFREQCRDNLAEGRVEALCCVRLFNEGADIPALRTVIIADTRPSGDISVLQAAMRSLRLHKSKANDTAQILQVVNATGAAGTVQQRVKRAVRQLASLWDGLGKRNLTEVEAVLEHQNRSRLQLLNLSGEASPLSRQSLGALIQARPQATVKNTAPDSLFEASKVSNKTSWEGREAWPQRTSDSRASFAAWNRHLMRQINAIQI